MRTWHTTLASGAFIALVAGAVSSQAQQVTIGTPFHTLQDHFYENNRIGFSGNYRGFNFSVNSAELTRPAFGNPQEGAGLSTNFAIVGKNGQINFSASLGQGYTQSSTTQAPSVTLMNGQTAYVSDTSQRPFVISVVPVVGGFPVMPQQMQQQMPQPSGIDPNPIDPRVEAMLQAHADAQAQAQAQPNQVAPRQEAKKPKNVPDPPAPLDPGEAAQERLNAAQESTAGRPAVSVAEAKRLRQQEQAAVDGEMVALMERARALEEDGKPSVAKIYYQRIAKHATGDLQQQARTRLYELQGKP